MTLDQEDVKNLLVKGFNRNQCFVAPRAIITPSD